MELQKGKCSHCGREFQIKVPEGAREGHVYEATFRCPTCGEQNRLLVGQRGPAGTGQRVLRYVGLPFGLLTGVTIILALAGCFWDITPVFRAVDGGLSSLLTSGLLHLDQRNLGILARIFVLLCCLPVHECAHALAALWLGDDTGKRRGRISLNPVCHLDPMGMVLILFVGVGYAKPVPVDRNRFRRKKLDFALTSVAGPLSNLIMSVFLLLMIRNVHWNTLQNGQLFLSFLSTAAYINVALAILNLLPIPPLDGSRVALALFPEDIYQRILFNERKVMGVLMVLLYLSSRAGYNPISLLTGRAFALLCGWIF